jgi:hypothetical protein
LNEWKELNIRGWKLIVGEVPRLHPWEFITTNRSWRTVQPRTLKQVKGYGFGLIVVIDLKQAFDGLHLHAQF